MCFPYPLVAFAGCGNRHHSGHCCSEIAFTDQSTRRSCIQPGEPGALHCRIVHRDGQCTLSLVWTQRTKERFYCKVWQVLFADCVCAPLSLPLSSLLAQSFCLLAACLLKQFHYICIILHFMTSLLIIGSYYPLFLSHLYTYTLFPDILTFYWHTSPASRFCEYIQSLNNHYDWICENLAQSESSICLNEASV